MMIRYNILSQVEIQHEYYGVKPFNDVEWFPTASTNILSENRDLVYKLSNGKLNIFVSSYKENDKTILNYQLQEPFSLTFYLRFKEPYWSNITHLNLEKGKKWFFTNLSIASKDNFLHKEEYVTNENQVTVVNQNTLYPINTKSDDLAIVKKGDITDIPTYAVQLINEEYYLNTKLLDEGLYQIKEKEKLIKEIFVSERIRDFDGICHLVYDNTQEGSCINKDWSWTKKSGYIRFATRKTHWQYFFPKEKMKDFEGVKVTNSSKEQVFDDGKEVVSFNGIEMICYTSLVPIELHQDLQTIFRLKKNIGIQNKSEGVIINRLPGPEKEILYRVDENGKHYSNIYINF